MLVAVASRQPAAAASSPAQRPTTTRTTTKKLAPQQRPEDILPQLPHLLAETFTQAQHSLAVHRKLTVSLFQTHLLASRATQETPRGTKLVGEKAFNDAFLACLNRCLPVRKGEIVVDRCLKFVGAYAVYAQAKFREEQRAEQQTEREEDEEGEDEEDTTATRFVEILLRHLLRGFNAKNKNVRLRCCQMVALLVNGLESLDDDLFETLKETLLERINDKESSVRVQAIVALAKLQQASGDGEDQADDEEDEVNDTLLWMLRSDSSAEVRRAALFNLALTPDNFPYILERLRDVDAINRRCVFLGSLAMLPSLLSKEQQAAGGTSTKTLLDPETTNETINIGLKDREEGVRRATRKLMGTWIDACGGDLEVFLQRFELLTSDVAEQALGCMFEQRPSLVEHVPLLVSPSAEDGNGGSEAFWNELTPAKALLAKVALQHLREKSAGVSDKWEDAMPPVTALAFRIQKHFNAMMEALEKDEANPRPTSDKDEDEEGSASQPSLETQEQTRIVRLLLDIALHADYADEIGRRKMFGLLREMLTHALLLPPTLLEGCLDLTLKLSNGQRDFMRIIVEVVQELDQEEDEEQSEESKNATDARRLLIVRGMLERVGGALQENTAFHGLLPQLIVPAVRSKNAEIREQGLICLGLSCLLDRALALDSFPLFVDQMQRGAEGVKLAAVQLVFDLVVVHGFEHLVSRNVEAAMTEFTDDDPALRKDAREAEVRKASATLLGFLLALLEDDDAGVQAAAAQGAAKLMLTGMIPTDEAEEVLKSIVLVYMSPETVDNQELKQCLSYFLPAYCYSSPTNQRRLRAVWLDVLKVLGEVYEDKDADQEMVAPPQIAMQLIDWMDSTKAIYPGTKDGALNADVAIDVLKEIIQDSSDQRKLFTQLLSKIILPDEVEESRANALLILCQVALASDLFDTAALSNSFARFSVSVHKKYADAAEALDVAACASADAEAEQDETYIQLSAFFAINSIDPVKLCAFAKQHHLSSASAAGAKKKTKVAASTSRGKSSSGRARTQSPADDEEDDGQDEQDDDEDQDDE